VNNDDDKHCQALTLVHSDGDIMLGSEQAGSSDGVAGISD